MPIDIRAQYAALIASGAIERDSAQEEALDLLAGLEVRLRERRLARKSSSLGWLFGARERRGEPIRGLYLLATWAAARLC
jgi:cell division protein ZapE